MPHMPFVQFNSLRAAHATHAVTGVPAVVRLSNGCPVACRVQRTQREWRALFLALVLARVFLFLGLAG
jgi:hypothetical protein